MANMAVLMDPVLSLRKDRALYIQILRSKSLQQRSGEATRPYCIIKLDGKELARTRTLDSNGSSNMFWGEDYHFELDSLFSGCAIEVMDAGCIGSTEDKFLGSMILPLSLLRSEPQAERMHPVLDTYLTKSAHSIITSTVNTSTVAPNLTDGSDDESQWDSSRNKEGSFPRNAIDEDQVDMSKLFPVIPCGVCQVFVQKVQRSGVVELNVKILHLHGLIKSGLIEGSSQIFCEVFLINEYSQKETCHKTRSVPYNFMMSFCDSTFQLSCSLPTIDSSSRLTIMVYQKRFFFRDILLGVFSESVNYFPNGRTMSFYSLRESLEKASETTSDSNGFLLVKYKFMEEIVMSMKHYARLEEIMLDCNRTVDIVRMLGDVTNDRDDVACIVLRIYEVNGISNECIRRVCAYDIKQTATPSALFRSSSVGTKLMDMYMKLFGQRYLQEVLTPVIEEIMNSEENVEVDPDRLVSDLNAATLENHWSNLIRFFKMTCERIFNSEDHCPVTIRRLFYDLRSDVLDHFRTISDRGDFHDSVYEELSYTSVSGFLFLRSFVPALISPRLFKLCASHPNSQQQRSLTLIAKALMILANYRTTVNEAWFRRITSEVFEQRELLKAFIDRFVVASMPSFVENLSETPSKVEPYSNPSITVVDIEREFAALHHHINACRIDMLKNISDNPRDSSSDNRKKILDLLFDIIDELDQSLNLYQNRFLRQNTDNSCERKQASRLEELKNKFRSRLRSAYHISARSSFTST